MAWNPKKYNETNITDHTLDFCKQQFGDEQAEEAARLLNLCCKYNGRITAEMLDRNTYNLETGEWGKGCQRLYETGSRSTATVYHTER